MTGPNPSPKGYDEQVASRYDAAVPVEADEIDFYLKLARDAQADGHPTLEVACGTGRVAVPLARHGIHLVGLDLSPAMLAVASERSVGVDTVRWVEGDMRSFDLGESFGLVTIPAGSFHLLLTTDDQLSCLRCIWRHLVPGGRLALELDNPDVVAMGDWLSSKRGVLQRRPERDYRHPENGRVIRSWVTRDFRPSVQEEVSTGVREEVDDDGEVVSRAYSTMRMRYVFRYEMEHLFARSGFEVEALYGSYSLAGFDDSSSEMVWVARRPA